MNEKIKILLVEDDKDQIQLFEDSIDTLNYKIRHEIVLKKAENLKDALEILTGKFDAAIIDLKLSGEKPEKEDGGESVVNEILENFRMPIFVYTGLPGLMGAIKRKEDIFFKKYVKGEIEVKTILEEIVNIYNSGITKIMGGRGLIEEKLNVIFWKHIANSFDYWMDNIESVPAEKVLLRYISSYLTEYLDITDEGTPESYFPPEFYIIPPVKKSVNTGDILKEKKTGKFYVVLTPACDMIMRENKVRNAEHVILVLIEEWNNIDNFSGIKKSTSKNNTNRKTIANFMSNKKSRYHFLPEFKDIPGFFIDFQWIKNENPDSINSNYRRIATISMPILKDIISRFSQYYTRQGQPDLNVEEELQKMLPDG